MQIDDHFTAATAKPLMLTDLSEGDGYGYAILGRVRQPSGSELR